MSQSTVEARIKGIIADQLGVGVDELGGDKAFVDDLGADSLDLVELMMAIEEAFEIEIPEEESETIRTVQDAIGYVLEHMQPDEATD